MKKQGFSLVELMISLIVISIITAAFAPVVTKKLKASGAAYIASGGSASTICNIQSNNDCKLCTKNTEDGLCLLCEATCTKGQYLDYDKCSCHNCTDTNCELCSEKECLKCKKGYEPDVVTGTCVISCNDKDLIRIGDLCVTKYNMGDKRKFSIPDTVKIYPIGVKANEKYTDNVPICRYGISSNKDTCTSKNGSYSGCGRTVCNWWAAREICSKLSLNGVAWRLPTIEEAMTFKAYNKNLGNNGLQLCSSSDETGASRCETSQANAADYSNYTGLKTYPYYIWSDTQTSADSANEYEYWNGAIHTYSYRKYGFYSVRCVQGSYPDISKQCTLTDPYCDRCSSDGTACTKCISGYELKNGVCVKNCGEGLYYDTTSYSCKPCPSGNHYCDGTNIDPCASFQWNNQGELCTNCTSSSIWGCATCKRGYLYEPHNFPMMCAACSDHCETCTSSTNCTKCDSGFSLISGYCQCVSGRYQVGNECRSCSEISSSGLCKTCSSGSCTSCPSGYILMQPYRSALDCYACPSNCLTCVANDHGGGVTYASDLTCTSCKSGYTLSSGSCIASSSSSCSAYEWSHAGETCTSCNSSGCTACLRGYLYEPHNYPMMCASCQVEHCEACSTARRCTRCETGYVMGDSGGETCVQEQVECLDSSCIRCDKNTGWCLECPPGASITGSGYCRW